MYVHDPGADNVRKLTPSGGSFVVSTILSGFGYNNVILAASQDGTGTLYLADSSTDSIFQAGETGSGWYMNSIAGGTTGDADGARRFALVQRSC